MEKRKHNVKTGHQPRNQLQLQPKLQLQRKRQHAQLITLADVLAQLVKKWIPNSTVLAVNAEIIR